MPDDTSDTPSTADVKAPRPRARRSVAKPAAEKPAGKTKVAKAPPKPRTSKRTAGAAASTKAAVTRTRKAATKAADKATKATDKVGGKWGAAAIAGGVVAAGAAAAALLLRGSTPRDAAPPEKGKGAKQADGTDSSASFNAGIADEGSIPKK